MTTALDPEDVVWLDRNSRQRPLCDVPWLGTSVVLSNGNVNFCCFSEAVVGNVREETFEQIWNGARMQTVRRALAEQRLPAECQSTSCPVFRGDAVHYLVDRMNGNATSGTVDSSLMNQRLSGSALSLNADVVTIGETFGLAVSLHWRGAPLLADLFIALRTDDGTCLFLPDYDDFAVPFANDMELTEKNAPMRIDVRIGTQFIETPCRLKVCAALFRAGSNPHLASNCYWSRTGVVAAK